MIDRSAEYVPGERESHGDIVIRLDSPDELFAADPRGLLSGSGRLDSGMDELVDRFLAQKRKKARHQRIVLDVAGECPPEVATNVETAVRHYCELRIRRADRQHGVIWRQGMRSLVSGSLLFVVGVVVSFAFTRPEVSEFWQELLGNELFLVVAWVGLWYPLDLLLFARQPLRREMRVLAEMLTVPVVVVTRSGTDRDSSPSRRW